MKELSYEEKVELFNAGEYICAPPPVCHVKWSDEDWMKWIDSDGEWYVDYDEEEENE